MTTDEKIAAALEKQKNPPRRRRKKSHAALQRASMSWGDARMIFGGRK